MEVHDSSYPEVDLGEINSQLRFSEKLTQP